MDSRLYRHVFGDLPKRRTVNHNCIPCYNLVAPGILTDISKNFGSENETNTISSHSDTFPFFRNFGYETDLCTVLYPGSGVVDRASKLVADKLLWEKKLTTLTPKDYNKAINSLKVGRENAVSELNSSLKKYLKHFKNDPEPNFRGDYNWLYTGGNIAGFGFGSSHYLITANEINNSMILNFIQLNPDLKHVNVEDNTQRVIFLQENDPVFQISCNNEIENLLFLIRQRQKTTLVKMKDNITSDYWTHKIDNGIFICSDLSSQSRNIATLDNIFDINIFDVEKGERTVLTQGEVKSPSWAQIMFNSNGNALYFADQRSFNIVDLRVAFNSSSIYKQTSTSRECEVISNIIKRKYLDNTFLIATSHNLYEVDVRNKKINQRWTHMMTSPPQFGKTIFRNGEEIIVLQSENPDETVGIINESKNSDFEFVSKSSPRLFDSVKSEWNKAQLYGICTHPGIRERLDFAITGLEILEDSNDSLHILTINGGGDVMVKKLKKDGERHEREHRDISDLSLNRLKKFEDHCLQTYSAGMTADELVDMSPLIKVLEEENLKEEDFMSRKAHWHQAEMYSPKSLCYFKDYMAERILDVWDVKMKSFCDVDDNFRENEDFYQQLQCGVSKVVQWMETYEGQ